MTTVLAAWQSSAADLLQRRGWESNPEEQERESLTAHRRITRLPGSRHAVGEANEGNSTPLSAQTTRPGCRTCTRPVASVAGQRQRTRDEDPLRCWYCAESDHRLRLYVETPRISCCVACS